MGKYSDLSVEELQTEIAAYRVAIRTAALGGEVGVVAGEGRRIEITRPDVGRAETELRILRAELARRPGFEHLGSGGAIRVEIG